MKAYYPIRILSSSNIFGDVKNDKKVYIINELLKKLP